MTAFATAEDVGARLGRTLTDMEETQAEAALDAVAGLIRQSARKPDSWDPDPVPQVFKTLSIEKAVGILTNPENLAAQSEQLGSLQRSQTFPRSLDGGIFLTQAEEDWVDDAIYTGTGTSRTVSVVDDLIALREIGEIDS